MANRYQWPRCTFPGCGHARTWQTAQEAESAYLRHHSWTQGDAAVCYCHGLEQGATFPCDQTQQAIHSV